MNAPISRSSVWIACIALICIPTAIWFEKEERTTWYSRLFSPDSTFEEPLHEPAVTDGIYLPPVIQRNTTLSGESPILIAGTVTVPKNVTLTLEPGSMVYIHEFGSLVVEGNLQAVGTLNEPIKITSNEKNTRNRNWSGVAFKSGSTGTIANTTIRYGSPAISCEEGANTSIRSTTIEFGNLALYTETARCPVLDSTIQAVPYGVIGKGVTPVVQNTVIRASKKDLQTFPK